MKGRVILVCGGYRSGSTLQYDLIGEYVERLNAGRRLGLVEPTIAALLAKNWSIIDRAGVAVAKCHHAAEGFRDWGGHDRAWLDLAEAKRAVPIYTERNWYDVIASMSRFWSRSVADTLASVEWRENIANHNAWMKAGALVQRFEKLTEDPRAALEEICDFAGLHFDERTANEAAVAVATAFADVGSGPATPEPDPRTLSHREHDTDAEQVAPTPLARRERDLIARALAAALGDAGTPAYCH